MAHVGVGTAVVVLGVGVGVYGIDICEELLCFRLDTPRQLRCADTCEGTDQSMSKHKNGETQKKMV